MNIWVVSMWVLSVLMACWSFSLLMRWVMVSGGGLVITGGYPIVLNKEIINRGPLIIEACRCEAFRTR